MSTNTMLPHALDMGTSQKWYLPEPSDKPRGVVDDDQQYLIVDAQFLGFGTSHAAIHNNHNHKQYVDRGTRCNACRWYEVRIFRELIVQKDNVRRAAFIIHTTGMSIVPTEQPLYKCVQVYGAHSVIEELTTRRVTDNGPEAFITKPSALALAGAASYDVDLEAAYIDRAVS